MGYSRSLTVLAAVALLSLISTSNAIQVTGATDGFDPASRARPVRQEINVFARSGAAWDLYILALQRFQNTPLTEPMSYFQVAGIHGYPKGPWDGVKGSGPAEGFCMHQSVLFPLWHRPYLALYEILSDHAHIIAKQYPAEKRLIFLDAASTLRIPYWDWAVNTGLPDVLTAPVLSVDAPDGLQSLTNPLLQYTFPVDMLEKNYFMPLSNAPNIPEQSRTVRQFDPITGQSNQTAASSDLQASSAGRLSKIYALLSNISNYTSFSLYQPGGLNIEGIHGDVHNGVGGLIRNIAATGHMTIISMSAYDPAFWLHHANIDRLVALWQALHPEEYVEPTVNEYGTYYLTSGSIDTEDTPLAPFHSDGATKMWTATMVRDITVFGYTYPELNSTSASVSELKQIVTREVNGLYAPLGNPFTNRTRRIPSRRSTNIAQIMSNVHADTALQLGVNNMNIQWYLRVSIGTEIARNSVAIFLFIGQPISDVQSWPSASNLIGLHTPYFTDNAPNAVAVSQHIDIPCSHTVAAAADRGILNNITPEAVVPFLIRNVVTKAVSQDSTVMDAQTMAGIQLSVLSRRVQLRKSISDFPVYSAFEEHASLTT